MSRVRLSFFPLLETVRKSTRQFHITKHSTYDALWRIKATPNKTMEPNQIEKNWCGYCAIHTRTHTQHVRNETQQHYPSKSSFCVKVFDPWPFWSACVCVFVLVRERVAFFSFIRTKLQYEKSAFSTLPPVFHILNLLTEHLIKNKACNQTPGRISIAFALQNQANANNSQRQTRTPITIPPLTSGNNVLNIYFI